jgi:hypothetical protein
MAPSIVRSSESPEALERSVGHQIESLGHEYTLNMKTIPQVVS